MPQERGQDRADPTYSEMVDDAVHYWTAKYAADPPRPLDAQEIAAIRAVMGPVRPPAQA